MKKFDEKFRTQLRKVVEGIESVSGVELVVTIVPRVRKHIALNLMLGSILAFVVLTLLMFLPTEFWYVLIYAETLAAFAVGYALPWLFPGLIRAWIGAQGRKREAEEHTRMLFQKAGMYETSRRAGVLIAWYWQEKELVILPDRGAAEWVPPAEWEQLRKTFALVFDEKNPPDAILKILAKSGAIWSRYIPRHEDDLNELPDELWMQDMP